MKNKKPLIICDDVGMIEIIYDSCLRMEIADLYRILKDPLKVYCEYDNIRFAEIQDICYEAEKFSRQFLEEAYEIEENLRR